MDGAPRQIGVPIKLNDGRTGHVHSVVASGDSFQYTIWVDGAVEGPLGDDALAD